VCKMDLAEGVDRPFREGPGQCPHELGRSTCCLFERQTEWNVLRAWGWQSIYSLDYLCTVFFGPKTAVALCPLLNTAGSAQKRQAAGSLAIDSLSFLQPV
jgi:hypothetical protein